MLGRGGAWVGAGGGGGGGSYLAIANNLSELTATASTARGNLGFTTNTAGRVLIGSGSNDGGTTDSKLVFDTVNKALAVNLTAAGTGATLDVGGTSGGVGLPVLTTVQRDAITPARNGVVVYNSTTHTFDGYINGAWTSGLGKNTTHSTLAGLTSGDDHTQYALLEGRLGGQTLYGGTAASNTLVLSSTSHATKGKILVGAVNIAIDEANVRIGVGTTSPSYAVHVKNVGDSLAEGLAIEGQGSGGARIWLQYVSPGGIFSLYNPLQGVTGVTANGAGQVALAAGALGHPDASVIVKNQAGRVADHTIVIQQITSQTGDAFRYTSVSDETVALAKITAAGLGWFTGIEAAAGTTLKLNGDTSGNVQLQGGGTITSYTLTLPTAQGAANQAMINNGSGALSWLRVPTYKAGANVALASGATSKAIVFATAFGSTSYSIRATLINTVDTDPINVPLRVIAKASTGFTVEWSDALPTDNYTLDWSIVDTYDP